MERKKVKVAEKKMLDEKKFKAWGGKKQKLMYGEGKKIKVGGGKNNLYIERKKKRC